MERFYKLTVPNVREKIRIDKYISHFIENVSRTKVQKAINLGCVTVNGNCVKSNYIVKPFDDIEIELPISEKQEILPENIPLDILYEDKFIIVINKPAGMVTHPAYKNFSGTLVNGLMYYSQQSGDKLSDLNGFERAGIVHRLDKDTSGILVVAKDEVSHRMLADQFFNHTINREYIALVWGKLNKKKDTITKYIGRDKRDRTKMAVVSETEGKIAVTEYSVLEEFEFLSLIKLKLKTGRTHQIRVHMSSIGHPVFGDETYGGRKPHSINMTVKLKPKINKLLELMPRQALHASLLGFIHPKTKEYVEFRTDLPDDMKNILELIR
ncbi:MAG: RluA family pseudouridine synthase [Ignavibacteria bacterium]|nr:RluA family pseudouridine synthase [Ignavibacteria bacterium]